MYYEFFRGLLLSFLIFSIPVLPLLFASIVITWLLPIARQSKKNISVVFVGLAITLHVGLASWFNWALWEDTLDNYVSEFHLFNAHLKALCIERIDHLECPKSEAELEAFNPRAYKKIQQTWQTYYFYDTNKKIYVWLLERNNLFEIASNILPENFGIGSEKSKNQNTPELQSALRIISSQYPQLVRYH